MGSTHREVVEAALRGPMVFIEYYDADLVGEFNQKRQEIKKRILETNEGADVKPRSGE